MRQDLGYISIDKTRYGHQLPNKATREKVDPRIAEDYDSYGMDNGYHRPMHRGNGKAPFSRKPLTKVGREIKAKAPLSRHQKRECCLEALKERKRLYRLYHLWMDGKLTSVVDVK